MKNNIKYWGLFIFLLTSFCSGIFAQQLLGEENKLDSCSKTIATYSNEDEHLYDKYINVLSSSPDVAELTRYAEIPVGYYSGIPDISIPLYTLKCGDIVLPISLSYHAGGIQVSQTASWVGLGWSLSAGGVVKVNNFSSKSYSGSAARPIDNLLAGEEYGTPYMDNYLQSSYIPPLYTYNFMGYTGKLLYAFFDNDHVYKDLSDSKELKPTFKYGRWGFVDQKGFIYKFFEREQSTIQRMKDNSPNTAFVYPVAGEISNEAYNLSTIVSPNNVDSITFSYKTASESVDNVPIANWTLRNNSGTFFKKEESYLLSRTTSSAKKLTSINASNGIRVEFVSTTQRLDINYQAGFPKQNCILDEVRIYDKNDNVLKIFRLNYDYFVSSVLNPNNDATQNYRLKLISVEEHGDRIVENPLVSRFEYYGEEAGAPQMPYRTAYSGHDCWGYFNRIPSAVECRNGEYLLPTITSNTGSIYGNTFGLTFRGSDMTPNLSYAQTYTLKKITYPLGGHRVFKYALNNGFGGLCIREIINTYGGGKADSVNYWYSGTIAEDPVKLVHKIVYDNTGGYFDEDLNLPELYVFSSQSLTASSYSGDSPGYTEVEEYFGEGFNRYQYYGFDDALTPIEIKSYRLLYEPSEPFSCARKLSTEQVPYGFSNGKFSRTHILGKLKSKTTFNANYELLKETYYWYTFRDKFKIPALEVNCEIPPWSISGMPYYEFNTSEIVIGEAVLDSIYNATYDPDFNNNGKYNSTIEKYTYNSEKLVDTKSVVNSDGNEHTTSFTYPFNAVTSSGYSAMIAKDMYNYPVQITQKINNIICKGEKVDYDSFSGKIYPSKFYSYEKNKGFDVGNPAYIIKSYTIKGKPQEIIGADNLPIVYLWGYNSQYPIAKIVGKSFDSVKQALPQYINWEKSYTITSSDLNSVRDAFPQKGIMVTTFLYDKFGNIIEETSPNDVSTYYEYDVFGRLVKATDQDGNILSEHQYNLQH